MKSVEIIASENLQKESTTKTRLHEVDFLRASAIILVILYHTFLFFDLDAYNDYTNQEGLLDDFKWALDHVVSFFRMPLLIFVSGYMFAFLKIGKGKYQDTRKLIRQKFKRLLLPYLVFAPITFFCYSLWKYGPDQSIFTPIGHLWFIVMLFWCFTVTQFVTSYINLALYKVFVPLFLVLCLCYPLSFAITDYLGLASCLRWLWCFILGYGCYSLPFSGKLRNLSIYNILALLVLCAIAIYWIRYIGSFDIKKAIPLHPIVMTICVLTIWGGVFYIGIEKPSRLFSSIIKSSYGMYVVHMWILSLIFFSAETLLPYINFNHTLFGLILFVSVVMLSFLISNLILKTRIGRYLIG